jgi:hypothetical protein
MMCATLFLHAFAGAKNVWQDRDYLYNRYVASGSNIQERQIFLGSCYCYSQAEAHRWFETRLFSRSRLSLAVRHQ